MNNRYHALDSMRAVMMLLGIYLHVVVGCSGNGIGRISTLIRPRSSTGALA